MKNQLKKIQNTLTIMILSLFTSVAALAQEGGKTLDADIDINTGGGGGGQWYTAPWVWIVGIVVFGLIIVAIVSAGRKS